MAKTKSPEPALKAESESVPEPVAPAAPADGIKSAFEQSEIDYTATQKDDDSKKDLDSFGFSENEFEVDDDEPVKAKEEEEEASPEPVAEDSSEPEISKTLIDKAVELGFTEEEAKSFGDNGKLDNVIKVFNKREPKEVKEVKDDPPAIEKFELDLSEEDYDEDFVKTINNMNEHYAQQLEKVTGQLSARDKLIEEIVDGIDARNESDFSERFDSWVSNLGGQYHDLLGKGPTASLKASGSEAKNRDAIRDEMEVLAAGYDQVGRDIPQESELFRRALQSVFGETVSRKNLNGKIQKRRSQMTNRPTYRAGHKRGEVPENPEQSAVEQVRAKLAGWGVSNEEDVDDYSGFHQ